MTTNNAVNTSLSGQTGTGSFVGSASPSLTTPNLGTPSAINLTNATALPEASIVGSAWTSFAGTIGFTGFSANPTGITAMYKTVGSITYVSIGMTGGTSNATSFTITGLPFAAISEQYVAIALSQNNSASIGTATGLLSSSSTTMTILNSGNPSGWTASGIKSASMSFFYETT